MRDKKNEKNIAKLYSDYPVSYLYETGHFYIFIDRRSAQSANPCQFRHCHGTIDISWVILDEHSGKVSFCSWPSSYLLAFGFRVRHTRADTGTNHGQFQFTERFTFLKIYYPTFLQSGSVSWRFRCLLSNAAKMKKNFPCSCEIALKCKGKYGILLTLQIRRTLSWLSVTTSSGNSW